MKSTLFVKLFLAAAVVTGSVMSFQTSPVGAQTGATAPTDAKKELNARLEERRARVKTKLSTADAAKVKGQCVAAQAKLAAISKKVNDNNTPYQTKFDSLIKRLQEQQQSLKANGTDTTTIDAQISTAGQKYQAYRTAIDQLNVSLSDAQSLDCVAEPNGFKSTVDDARQQLKAVQATRKDATKYVKETLVTTLKTIKPATGDTQ